MFGQLFNVIDFDKLVNEILDVVEEIIDSGRRGTDFLIDTARIVASEDSGLSAVVGNVSGAVSSTMTQVRDKANELIQELMNYRTQTLENEKTTEAEIKPIQSVIDNVMAALNGISAK